MCTAPTKISLHGGLKTWIKTGPEAESNRSLRSSANSPRLRLIAAGSISVSSGADTGPTTICPPVRSCVSRATGTFALLALRIEDRTSDFIRSTGSTKTWIRPPQLSPTDQASSLAMPNSSSSGSPVSMTSCARRITSPSMQPPETEPMNRPESSASNWLPGGRGDEPQVATTVASATRRPSLRQAAANSNRSSSCAIFTHTYGHCSFRAGRHDESWDTGLSDRGCDRAQVVEQPDFFGDLPNIRPELAAI